MYDYFHNSFNDISTDLPIGQVFFRFQYYELYCNGQSWKYIFIHVYGYYTYRRDSGNTIAGLKGMSIPPKGPW